MSNIKDIFVSKDNILSILEYIKQYVNTRVVNRMGNVGWNDLTDDCKSMIENGLPTVSSSGLMTIVGKDGKTYYIKGVMTGLPTPSIATTSTTALETEDVSVSASITSSGAVLWYKYSKTSFSANDKIVNPSNMPANGWSTSNKIPRSVWTRGLSSYNIISTVYVAVVGIDSGLSSNVVTGTVNITRHQVAPSISFNGNNYSSSRTSSWNSSVPSGFKKQYSINNSTWFDYPSEGIKCESSARASMKRYFRLYNDISGEVSITTTIDVIVSEKQIYIYAAPDKYLNAASVEAQKSSFTALGKTTMSKTNQKFNSTSAYYPTIAIPAGYKFKFYVLGSLQGSSTYTKVANVNFGNLCDVYIINSQQSPGEHEIEIEVTT